MQKYYDVTDEEYKNFIKFCVEKINNYKEEYPDIQIVSIYRGSLGMGAHLSNLLNVPLSIIKFQKYDGNDDYPKFLTSYLQPNSLAVILDDIYDTGETMNRCIEFIKICSGSECLPITMFGKDSPFLSWNHHDGESWYRFPWEV
jgi:hypoxanthine phosphoribosyltransferase